MGWRSSVGHALQACQTIRERFSLDEFQDEKLCGAGIFQSVDRGDVRMIQ